MGLEQHVRFAPESTPSWAKIRTILDAYPCPVQMCMIDGELAFPDEVPPEPWRELRLKSPAGMVTLRRTPGDWSVVVWGNADVELRRFWNLLTWACAVAGPGQVETAAGWLEPQAYREQADLPIELRP